MLLLKRFTKMESRRN